MLWSAFTLAFYSFLRSSEFTAPSPTQFNPLVHLSNSDVSFNSGGCLTLHLKSSKTDPYRQGCTLLIAPSHRSVCAVRALKKYLSTRSFNSTSPLYVFQSDEKKAWIGGFAYPIHFLSQLSYRALISSESATLTDPAAAIHCHYLKPDTAFHNTPNHMQI